MVSLFQPLRLGRARLAEAERCLREAPPLEPVSPGHVSACWVAAELGQKATA
jgi:hypothetical protein